MKVFTNRAINDIDEGIIYQEPDGKYLIKGIFTKPNGSNSNYLSIGKFSKKVDEFGDTKAIWEHRDYPQNFHMEGFSVKRNYNGRSGSAQLCIEWSFVVPQAFLDDGFGIAIIGSGRGGQGYRSTSINIFFDLSRINRGTDVIRA